MTAVDTNVIVRLLIQDDPKQASAARAIFGSGPIWIARTVFLETSWVLRGTYRFGETEVRDAFVSLMGLPNVFTEDRASLAAALDLMAHGLDFADALHLSSKPRGAAFVTFDRTFVSRAQRAGLGDVRQASTSTGK